MLTLVNVSAYSMATIIKYIPLHSMVKESYRAGWTPQFGFGQLALGKPHVEGPRPRTIHFMEYTVNRIFSGLRRLFEVAKSMRAYTKLTVAHAWHCFKATRRSSVNCSSQAGPTRSSPAVPMAESSSSASHQPIILRTSAQVQQIATYR